MPRLGIFLEKLKSPGNSICIYWSSDFFLFLLIHFYSFPQIYTSQLIKIKLRVQDEVPKFTVYWWQVEKVKLRVQLGHFPCSNSGLPAATFFRLLIFKCFPKLINKFRVEESTVFGTLFGLLLSNFQIKR